MADRVFAARRQAGIRRGNDSRLTIQRRNLSRVFFMQLVMQFIDLQPRLFQRLPSTCGDLIHPSPAPPNVLQFGAEESAAFQPVEERIERSRPDVVSVVLQLLHHGQPENRLVNRVQEHVDPYKAEKEFPLMWWHN